MFERYGLFSILLLIGGAFGLPKIGDDNNGGFLPMKNFVHIKDQVAMESNNVNETLTPSASDKAGRFGFPTYASDVQSVNNVVPGVYGPVKLDIGGLVLGTIVGLGAFFILPKILHVFTSPYGGGYKRSEDENAGNGLSISEISQRVSDSLESMHLDTSSCIQRAICSTMQTPSLSNGIVDSITKNDLMKTLISGTKWEKAVEVGGTAISCGSAFPKCPFSVESVVKPIAKYLTAT